MKTYFVVEEWKIGPLTLTEAKKAIRGLNKHEIFSNQLWWMENVLGQEVQSFGRNKVKIVPENYFK